MAVSQLSAPSPDAVVDAGVLPVALAGMGVDLPDRVVTNDDLAERLDTSDEWIRTRTGIAQRHIAAEDEATSDLALAAAERALEDAGCPAGEVAAVIVATTSPDHTLPATAPIVAAGLGTEVVAFDLNAACTGFLYGLYVGGSLAAGRGGPVLLVGAEVLSRMVDWSDRSTAVLFGDGAAAVLLVRDEDARLGPFDLGSDGRDPSMLWTRAGGTRCPLDQEGLASGEHLLTMRGREIYRQAVDRMSRSSRSVLEAAGRDVEDVDLLIGHQANARILAAVADRLGLSADRNHLTIDQHGNTSAASVPLALADARDRGRLGPGDTVLLTAFGAGLTFGSCLLEWGGAPVESA